MCVSLVPSSLQRKPGIPDSPPSQDIDLDDDHGSIGTCSSGASAHTHTSSRSAGARSNPGRPSSVARGNIGGSSSGAVDEAAFEKYFQDTPQVNVSVVSFPGLVH